MAQVIACHVAHLLQRFRQFLVLFSRKSPWEMLSVNRCQDNKDCVYIRRGSFRNWHAFMQPASHQKCTLLTSWTWTLLLLESSDILISLFNVFLGVKITKGYRHKIIGTSFVCHEPGKKHIICHHGMCWPDCVCRLHTCQWLAAVPLCSRRWQAEPVVRDLNRGGRRDSWPRESSQDRLGHRLYLRDPSITAHTKTPVVIFTWHVTC